MRRWFPFLVIIALGTTMVLSVGASADPTRRGHRPHRQGSWKSAIGPQPDKPCGNGDPDNAGCDTSSTTGGSTTGSSSGATAGTTSTTSGTTATTAGSTGTTSGTNPNPPPGDPAPPGGSNPPGGGTPPTATAGGTNAGGTNAGGTNAGGTSAGGTTSGGTTSGWDDSGSGTTVDGGADALVSGTNDNATFTLNLKRTSASAPTQLTVKSVDVVVGTETVPNQSITQTFDLSSVAVGASWTFSERFRFASTHFADATPLPIKATIHYQFAGGSVVDRALPPVTVTTCNRGLATSTTQEYGTSSYYTPNPLYPQDGYSTASHQGGLDAVSNLKGMNHSLPANPGLNPPNTVLGRSAILSALQTTTAYFGFTHGESDGFLASYVEATANDRGGDKLLFAGGATSTLGAATLSGRVIQSGPLSGKTAPLPNMVLLYACSTLQANTTDAPGAFGILAGAQTPDHAYAGFDGTLMSLSSASTQSTPMSQHAGRVYQLLLRGSTLRKAVDDANGMYHPVDSTNHELKMQVVGDPNARLVNAYSGLESTSSDTWYRFP